MKYGSRCSFGKGETLYSAGEELLHCYVVTAGEIEVVDQSGDECAAVMRYGVGEFTGEVNLLLRRRSLVTCRALGAVGAIRLSIECLRAMFIREPVLGARLWETFQRRREFLLTTPFQGLRIYSPIGDEATLQLVEFLYRNSVPHHTMDAASPGNLERVQELTGGEQPHFPLVCCGRKLLFQAPSFEQIAEFINLRHPLPRKLYDVVILGSGPSGLGAAVYAASEGLGTLVLDEIGLGGQAGSSSKIENYAGFPNGIAGRDLAGLSYLQAVKFGAEFIAPAHVEALRQMDDGHLELRTRQGDVITGKTVIIATGVSYQLLDVAGLSEFHGSGVYYNATAVEALLCRNTPVHIVGGGNSAGQAAMFLSQYTKEVNLIVRGGALSKTMSSYLSERVLANPRVKVRYHTQVVEVEGRQRLHAVHLCDRDGQIVREETGGLFVFIGAKPRTGFLPPEVARDSGGFILTGPQVVAGKVEAKVRPREPLETSLPNVLACGDCRSGTTKRVAFAIGDGSLAVTCVHNLLGTYA